MSRQYTPHTLDVLKAKLEDVGIPHELPEAVMDDLKKVQFDWENYEYGNGQGYNGCENITGFNTTPGGLPFLGVTAGGDWEVPVFLIVYYDGKKLRGYIPTDGNTWNTKAKAAYGNNYEGRISLSDGANLKQRYPELFEDRGADEIDHQDCPECDPAKILADIDDRIVRRSAAQHNSKTAKSAPEPEVKINPLTGQPNRTLEL